MQTGRARYGLIADVHAGTYAYGRVSWDERGIIVAIDKSNDSSEFASLLAASPPKAALADARTGPLITPPLVNAHVHIESSMLVPSRLGPACLACGVGATVSDPHEIANVLGVAGIDFMIENAKLTPLRIHFGAPSCVPATSSEFETAGAELGPAVINALMQRKDIHYLAEVMNFPGVLAGEAALLAKIASAVRTGKVIDGHAPGLRGAELQQYAARGISTDHECSTLAEAHDKLSCGMKILIREGSAAKNFEALWPIVSSHPESAMLCSDDLHPDELLSDNIDSLCRWLLRNGCSLSDVLRVATLNPVQHYRLDLGLLRVGDKADFVVWSDTRMSAAQETVLAGETVWRIGDGIAGVKATSAPNLFRAAPISAADLRVAADRVDDPIIEVIDRQIVTKRAHCILASVNGQVLADTAQDVVKLVVVNRYEPGVKPALCFVKNTGIVRGAIGTSVGHDSHNIIACGADDAALVAVINAIVASQGGIGCAVDSDVAVLPLPVAGLMSDSPANEVAQRYRELSEMAKQRCGSTLTAPFMTLSFLALPVIPELKLTDKGLFDVTKFAFV